MLLLLSLLLLMSLFLLHLLEELLNLACSLLVLHFNLSQLIHLLYIPGQLRKHVSC